MVAFTADEAYCNCNSLHNLPVIPFEKLSSTFPPEIKGIHLAIGWKYMNGLRAQKLAQVRDSGYSLVSYISSHATIWADLQWGENCAIHQNTSIAPFVKIGDNCMIFPSSYISHDAVIGNDCYIAAGVGILGGALIEERCVLGAGCKIMDGIKVASGCFIAAGAVVFKNTEENGVYMGMSAKRRNMPADELPIVL